MGDVFEETEEGTITIGEYIKEVEDQELEADLVLGGDEGKECTYYNGYMKRQAIFSCLTCTPNGNAGVCTACSLACHDGHEIVELWTKRKFRCDCGNSKFGEFFCKLYANKDIENIQNSYNQNFKGLYCTCARPYPDLEVEEQVEMIQCCICEDWFHEDHLGLDPDTKIPRDEEGEPCYEDFICKDCSSIFSFLTLYPQHIWAMSKESGALKNINCKDEEVTDPSSSSSRKLDNNICLSDISKGNGTPIYNVTNGLNENYSAGESSDRVLSFNPEANETVSDKKCLIGFDLYKASHEINEKKPMFMSKNWRLFLCKCSGCEEFYSQKGINYLIDAEDSIGEYEKIAKQKREEKLRQQEGVELTFLEKLGHVQKIEILNGIAEMKNELLSFLESFDRTKSVTSEDVQHVFENLAKKRQRLM